MSLIVPSHSLVPEVTSPEGLSCFKKEELALVIEFDIQGPQMRQYLFSTIFAKLTKETLLQQQNL